MKNTRSEIWNILNRVLLEGGYASLIMREGFSQIDEKDRAFASEVIYGTIRNYTLLESQWQPYARKIKPKTAVLLDFTVYQMFFMNTENYAAVNEAVNLVARHEKGFVNAVLRKVSAKGLVLPQGNALEEIALRTSHPLWLLQMWKAHYGKEPAVKIAEADQKRPVVFGRINTLKIQKTDLEKKEGIHFLNDISFQYDGLIQNLPEFHDGRIVIQDIHSAKVVQQLDAKEGMQVLDACAAPGTKTQEIAMLMHNKGRIIAGEIHENRIALIENLMKQTGVSIVQACVRDASEKAPFADETFDRILLDVPCSGLGDLSHKPEIRYHVKPESIDALVELQRRILSASAPLLKSNGIMVYSTCTLNKKENEKQISRFLDENPDFELLKEETMFPFADQGDGFYYAKMKKK